MTFKPVLPLVDYVVNYDYISEVLCINKDKPELQCNGKCHLNAELAKSNEDTSSQDKHNQKSMKRMLQIEFVSDDSFSFTPLKKVDIQQKVNVQINETYFYLYSPSIFHPPLVA